MVLPVGLELLTGRFGHGLTEGLHHLNEATTYDGVGAVEPEGTRFPDEELAVECPIADQRHLDVRWISPERQPTLVSKRGVELG